MVARWEEGLPLPLSSQQKTEDIFSGQKKIEDLWNRIKCPEKETCVLVFELMTEGALQFKFTLAHLINVQWYFIMGLIFISLIINEVEHFFIRMWTFGIPLL